MPNTLKPHKDLKHSCLWCGKDFKKNITVKKYDIKDRYCGDECRLKSEQESA